MRYCDLNPAQRAQVERLFCDERFDKQPAWFDYVLDQHGQILSRARLPEFKRPADHSKARGLACRLDEVSSPVPLTLQQELARAVAIRVIARHLSQILSKGAQ